MDRKFQILCLAEPWHNWALANIMNSTATVPSGLSPVLIGLRTFSLTIFAMLIISGNILSIAVTRRVTNIADSTKVLMTSLAACDLFIGVLVILIAVVSALGRWPFEDVGCQICATVTGDIFFMSILSLTFLNIERYIAVTRPYKYLEWCTRRRAIALVAIGVTLCLPLGPLPQVVFAISSEYFEGSFFCFYSITSIYFNVICLLVIVIFPTLLMPCIYHRLIKISRKHEQRLNQNGNNEANNNKENKALKTFLVVTLTFVGCCTPYLLVRAVNGDSSPMWLEFSATLLGTGNSFFNVWIYCLFNSSFRKMAKTILLERFLCCNRSVAPVLT